VSGVAIDVLATLVFHYTSQNRPFYASTLNTVLSACFIYVFVDITKDNWIAVPYLMGIWVGGMIGMTIKKKLESHEA
jgi:hypothetical protein